MGRNAPILDISMIQRLCRNTDVSKYFDIRRIISRTTFMYVVLNACMCDCAVVACVYSSFGGTCVRVDSTPGHSDVSFATGFYVGFEEAIL